MCVSPDSPEFDQAMQDLIECGLAIAGGSTDTLVFLRRAQALWMVRDLEGAVADYDRAISANPPLPPFKLALAYAGRAICHHQLGDLDQAIADATASLSLTPRAHAYALRSLSLYRRGQLEEALADAREAVRRDPRDWEARAFQGKILLEMGDYTGALADFTWVIESGECHRYASELYLARARAHLVLGDPAAAEADCTISIDQDYHEQAHWPFIVRGRVGRAHHAYLVRAEARLALGATARALGDCFHAASLALDDPTVYELRARVYQTVGNLTEATHDLLRAAFLRRSPAGAPEQLSEPTLVRSGP